MRRISAFALRLHWSHVLRSMLVHAVHAASMWTSQPQTTVAGVSMKQSAIRWDTYRSDLKRQAIRLNLPIVSHAAIIHLNDFSIREIITVVREGASLADTVCSGSYPCVASISSCRRRR